MSGSAGVRKCGSAEVRVGEGAEGRGGGGEETMNERMNGGVKRWKIQRERIGEGALPTFERRRHAGESISIRVAGGRV